jgi:hypothetical protein
LGEKQNVVVVIAKDEMKEKIEPQIKNVLWQNLSALEKLIVDTKKIITGNVIEQKFVDDPLKIRDILSVKNEKQKSTKRKSIKNNHTLFTDKPNSKD